jgi:WD40 repeat protein
LSCLPCGHIYGKRYVLTATRTFYPCRHLSDARSCLAQWLREKKFCPHCKAKVRKSSAVIQLYAPNARVVAVEGESTSEVRIRQLQEELKTMREHNKRLLDDKKSLTQQIAFLNKAIPAPPAANNSNVAAHTAALVDVHATLPLHDLRVELHHVMRVPKVRSVAQCQSRDVLLMSIEEHKTGRGGVLKMSLSDPSSTQVTWCHDKMIGMIKVHPNLPQYLTASQDHTVKCHSLDSMQTLVTWSCPGPVWSVEWDHDHDQLCYVGLVRSSTLRIRSRAHLTRRVMVRCWCLTRVTLLHRD